MKTLVKEWVEKAEGDYALLTRECRVRRKPNYDGICFHAQQCAEKYLKARLVEAGKRYGKVHDLLALLDAVVVVEPAWADFREDLAILSNFAINYRYPGESADRAMALDARRRCRRFRKAARVALGVR